ncbi:hypothetical protein [Rahnella sp. NRRL B-41462]|uniref:hypothetical protein n=1 Tax=Rahnella sp. NRRL B-41462 TaxID=1610579 RepID=UPI000DD41F6C|nr:hypothetical protein [Rahnella sp. NRRL B-41462]
MLVLATSNKKILIESGTFNAEVDTNSEATLKLVYAGLNIYIITNILPDSHTENEGLSVSVEGNSITFKHSAPLQAFGAPCGLIIPNEVGTKSNGKKIYISWLSFFQKTANNRMVVATMYSLYEDE